MKLVTRTVLTGAAALSLLGAVGAQAETLYEPNILATSPGYVYTAPTFGASGYASGYEIGLDGRAVIAEPPSSYVVVAPPREVEVVVNPPIMVAPRESYAPREVYEPRVLPRDTGIVTTGTSSSRSCFTDVKGFERCY